MDTITKFSGREQLSIAERRRISELLYSTFRQKVWSILDTKDKLQGIDVLMDVLSFNKGVYCKKDREIIGVALVSSKESPCFVSFREIIKKLGVIKGVPFYFAANRSVKLESELKINFLAVDSPYRRRGIGRLLIRQAHSMAVNEKYKQLTLDVGDTNLRARLLYERLGFKSVKEITSSFAARKAGIGRYIFMSRAVV